MTIRTREKSTTVEEQHVVNVYPGNNGRTWSYGSVTSTSMITDVIGVHKYTNGHLTWKPVTHVKDKEAAHFEGLICQKKGYGPDGDVYYPFLACQVNLYRTGGTAFSPEYATARSAAYAQLLEEIDLNCHDRVMGYSYVADLIPLIAPFTRASSILNRIGRWASKRLRDFKRRPFTEVLSMVINADFINRFVVQTTIQDTKHILDVYDRCLRTWQVANQRNAGYTVLTTSVTTGTEGPSRTYNYTQRVANFEHDYWVYNAKFIQQSQLSLKARLSLSYDTADADPSLWVAHALGIDTPLESVWDKIPFSFVVDYFFRVGEFIERVGDMSGQNGLMGRVCGVEGIWEMWHHRSGYQISSFRPTLKRDYACKYEVGKDSGFTGWHTFERSTGSLSQAAGFWDNGGLWKPHLSSVRKRTLLELGWQMLGRGRS